MQIKITIPKQMLEKHSHISQRFFSKFIVKQKLFVYLQWIQ